MDNLLIKNHWPCVHMLSVDVLTDAESIKANVPIHKEHSAHTNNAIQLEKSEINTKRHLTLSTLLIHLLNLYRLPSSPAHTIQMMNEN